MVELNWTLALQILNFAVLFLVLRRIFWRRIAEVVEARRREIADNLQKAEAARKEAEEMRRSYEEEMRKLREEARQIREQARRQAEEMKEQIIRQGREEARRILEAARLEIRQEKYKALTELRDEVVDLTIMAAEKLLGRAVTADDHRRMVRELVEKVGNGD